MAERRTWLMCIDGEWVECSTRSTVKCFDRVQRTVAELRCRIARANSYRIVFPIVPFGGRDRSGCGLESGQTRLESHVARKSVSINASEALMPDPLVMR